MNIEQIIVGVVGYSALNDLVAETLGIKHFECHLESPNDTDYLIQAITAEPFDKWGHADWEKIKKDGSSEAYKLGTVLKAMCIEGKIPPGNYLVRVS